MNRIKTFDIAKGVAFIAVVWGHFMSRYGTMFVYTFNLPLFFVVSGYFLNTRKSPGNYGKEKAAQLLLPYLYTSLGLIILSALKEWLLHRSFASALTVAEEVFKKALYGVGLVPAHPMFAVDFIGPIWFLFALFFALLIVRYAISLKYGFCVVMGSMLVGYYSSRMIWFPLELQAGMVLAGYVYVGWLLKRVVERLTEAKRNTYITFLGVFCVTFLLWMWFYAGEKELIFFCINEYPRGLIDFAGPVAAILSVILMSHLFLQYLPVLSDLLVFVGQNTLLMLCFHTLDDRLYSWGIVTLRFPLDSVWTIVLILVLKIALYCVLTGLWLWIRKKWQFSIS